MKVKFYLDNERIYDFTQIWTNRLIFEEIEKIDVEKETHFFIYRPWKEPFEFIHKNLKGKGCKIVLWIVDCVETFYSKESDYCKQLEKLSDEDIFLASPNFNSNDMEFPVKTSWTYSMLDPVNERKKWNHNLLRWLHKHSKNYVRQKHFLSFNGTLKHHRFDLLNFICSNKLADKFYVSFGSNQRGDKIKLPDDVKENMTQEEISYYTDKHLDIPKDSPYMTANLNFTLYFNSYFDIVTATECNTDSVYIDEKVWKSFASFKPMILIGEPLTLKFLRGLGFRTFSPFIDESYDDVTDYDKRKKIIYDEITRLSNLTLNELDDIYWKMTDVLNHNFNQLNKVETNTNKNLVEEFVKSYD